MRHILISNIIFFDYLILRMSTDPVVLLGVARPQQVLFRVEMGHQCRVRLEAFSVRANVTKVSQSALRRSSASILMHLRPVPVQGLPRGQQIVVFVPCGGGAFIATVPKAEFGLGMGQSMGLQLVRVAKCHGTLGTTMRKDGLVDRGGRCGSGGLLMVVVVRTGTVVEHGIGVGTGRAETGGKELKRDQRRNRGNKISEWTREGSSSLENESHENE